MGKTVLRKTKSSEFAIFARLLGNRTAVMSPHLARYVLTLGFDAAEQKRMEQLAEKNQAVRLSADEHDELMSCVKAGHLLALLHSEARKALKKKKVS